MIVNTKNNGAEIIMHWNEDSGLEINTEKAEAYENGIKQAQ